MIDLCYLFFVFAAYYTNASPIALPQAVTALISPSAPSQPGCTGSYPGVFGIAVMNISTSTPETTSATLPRRRQESESRPAPIFTMAAVSQIGDGQVQGGMHTLTMAPVSQIEDGQIQNSAAAFAAGYSGQQSAACATATATSTASSTSMIGDKPPTVLEQACGISVRPTASPVMLLPPSGGDAASASPSAAVPSTTTSVNISTSSSRTSISTSSPTSTAESAPSSPPRPLSLVSCLTNSTLRLSLNDGVLVDGKNRTGYIASNLQFQFDGPPQSGAIYTAGWSVCPVDAGDGGQGQMSLALGGNTTFYQCLSGKFYNLYTENWAAQCSPVQLRVVRLVDC